MQLTTFLAHLPLALGLWIALCGIAIANGYIGQIYVVPHLGESGTQIYKTVAFLPAIAIAAGIYVLTVRGEFWAIDALAVGILWVALTSIFEFLFGRYVLGMSWETLLAAYQIWRGELWLLVLLATGLAPLAIASLINH